MYLKIILTLIFLVLLAHLFKPSRSVDAGDVRDVNIARVGGYSVTGGAIKVK